MDPVLENLIVAVAREGKRRHARWDGALFDEVACGPALALWKSLKDQPQPESVLSAYFQLVQEALGTGFLKRADGAALRQWPNFLTLCLVHLVPASLAAVPNSERIPLLAKVWNLCEGLLREPAWVDQYVTALAAQLSDLADIEGFLVRTLEPALAPTKPARWEGPFVLAVLNARPLDDDFLPGEMHLAAPVVLCVHDRRRAGVHLGLFLQHGRRSRFLGLTPCLGQHGPAEGLPAVQVTEQRLQVGSRAVDLPFLNCCREHALAGPGFAVFSAVDSQRLWVVETP